MRDLDEETGPVWKVTHAKNDVESVYLVNAKTNHDARKIIQDMLFELEIARALPVCDPYDPKFRMETRKQLGAFSVTAFVADPPYKLYSINVRTGEMSA
jgi:hypothetical protein